MPEVALRGVTKHFADGRGGTRQVLQGVDIEAASGQFVALLGPSGCGKTTSLRIIAGLEQASSGDVLIDGVRVNDQDASARNLAMVFQNYALFPHLTVMENITFGLHVRRVRKADRLARGREAAAKVGLQDYLEQRPAQLSGGQRQRTALARALVSDASVVLMDEPLSNLDATLRNQMRLELRALQRDLGLTVIYVTHDQVEAMTMADHVVVMRDGAVAQAAPPMELYTAPADTGVARFIGSPAMNLIQARADQTGLDVQGVGRWLLHTGVDGQITVGIRPEALRFDANSADPGSGGAGDRRLRLGGTVTAIETLGAETLVMFAPPGRASSGNASPEAGSLVARLPGIATFQPGDEVTFVVEPSAIGLFDPESGRALPTVGELSTSPRTHR